MSGTGSCVPASGAFAVPWAEVTVGALASHLGGIARDCECLFSTLSRSEKGLSCSGLGLRVPIVQAPSSSPSSFYPRTVPRQDELTYAANAYQLGKPCDKQREPAPSRTLPC